MTTTVPNKHPTASSARRIAFIGEAPGADEVRVGQPFVGYSGRLLDSLMEQAGLSRATCFMGNICQHRPPENKFSAFAWTGPEVQDGMATLAKDIATYDPHLVVLLGNVPLRAAKDPVPTGAKYKHSNDNWRGSLFRCDAPRSPFYGRKCMATYHPAFVLRDYGKLPLLMFDIKRAAKEGGTPELVIPKREIVVARTVDEALNMLWSLNTQRSALGSDIEGYVHRLQCIAFAPDKEHAYVIPFILRNNSRHFQMPDELRVWRSLTTLLENPIVPKIWQNGLYDRFVLHYGHGIRVRGNQHDIMLKHWELNSELSKGENNADKRKAGLNLALQASIYTNEPYYKFEYDTADDETFWQYNGKDACVTKEINDYLDKAITAECSKKHYRLNVSLLNPLLYMEIKGIAYDVKAAEARRKALQEQLYAAQARLNALTGRCFTWSSLSEMRNHAKAVMLTVKGDRPLKDYIESWSRLQQLLGQNNPTLATIGEIEDLCEISLNTGSNKQMIEYLYETLKLPVQYTNDETPRPTANYEALLKLSRVIFDDQEKWPLVYNTIIQTCIEIRALATRQEMLSISCDNDGRIRCGYNIVGSNTGRITCYKSPTGSGYNLQTIPNYTSKTEAPGRVLGDRDLFLADHGHWFFQCDLKGADGWTVAAYCAMLGDRTMLDDYLYGLKPYMILAAQVSGYLTDPTDRAAIKNDCKRVDKDSQLAFANKSVQHGVSYMEGDLTISRSIHIKSEGRVYMPTKECGQLKRFFLQRYYGIPKWHDWIASKLRKRAVLVAASGQVREFFGRRDEIITKAVAFEPQANTTYATNLAMSKLWNDPANRLLRPSDRQLAVRAVYDTPTMDGRIQAPSLLASDGVTLRIQPLHQVHDALCGQFKKEDTSWAVAKIKSYFDNPLQIAGQDITIPFDGGYGESWGSMKEGTI